MEWQPIIRNNSVIINNKGKYLIKSSPATERTDKSKKMIKLIATDVDRTLLDNDSNLPDLNKQAIVDCKNNGIGVILATGKTITSIKHLVETLSLRLPQITISGASVVDNNYNLLRVIKFNPGCFYELLKTIKDKGHKPLITLSGGDILYDSYDPNFSIFDNINELTFKVDRLEKDEYAGDCVCVGVAIRESDPLDRFLRQKYKNKLNIMRSGDYFFDIVQADASKGSALSFISGELNIRKEEIAVFGDSPNDLSMFDFAQLRIAVRNSYPEVLRRADIITDDSSNCGFAKAVYKHILNTFI